MLLLIETRGEGLRLWLIKLHRDVAASRNVAVKCQSQVLCLFVCYARTGERDREPEEELGSGEDDCGRLRHSAGRQPGVRATG